MRAAIIGCGPFGPRRGGVHSISYGHARAMQRAGDAIQLVAAASRTEKNVQDFVAEFPGVRGYQDYRAMLAAERPEFVSVCAFPPDREAMVLAALEAGAKAVWVEKPFAISMGAARRMIEAAEAHGARLFVNFQRRFGKPFEWTKEAVAAGRIGRLIGVQISQPGEKAMEFGPHLVDAALNVMNAPAERTPVRVLGAVEWSGGCHQGVLFETQLVGTVHFSDGTRMFIEAGKHSPERAPILRFDGEHGFVELRMWGPGGETGTARGCFKGSAEVTSLESEENFHHGADPNLYTDRALKDILHAVATGGPSRLDAVAVLPGLEILLGIFESANERRMVTLPLVNMESPFRRP